MLAKHILAGLGWTTAQIATASPVRDLSLPAHTISRQPAGYRFENLAIRPDGQILTTTASPGANIFQIDPLGILPPTLVYEVPLVNGSAAGINEGERDVYYVVAGMFDILNTSVTHPDTYQIVELDMRGTFVLTTHQYDEAGQVHHSLLRDADLVDYRRCQSIAKWDPQPQTSHQARREPDRCTTAQRSYLRPPRILPSSRRRFLPRLDLEC